MDWESRCMRLCGGVIAGALILRLAAGGFFAPVGEMLRQPAVTSFLVYLQTGRVVRLAADLPQITVPETVPTRDSTEIIEKPSFSADDASLIDVKYNCDYRPDLAGLLTEPLDWNLKSGEPTVLILHTHTTESYTKSGSDTYEETSSYRTLEPDYNMLSLGALVAQALEEAGIPVIHDQTFHDYPSYNGSYTHAAASTAEYLEAYPSIRLVLDLHRDAADTPTGQMSTSCSVGGETSAQLMMVVGTDAGALEHPQWQENLSIALKLQALLEKEHPGICRPLNLTYQRYNQHLGDRALLIEIGAAGNTLQEAKIAAAQLAQAIIQLSNGST